MVYAGREDSHQTTITTAMRYRPGGERDGGSLDDQLWRHVSPSGQYALFQPCPKREINGRPECESRESDSDSLTGCTTRGR